MKKKVIICPYCKKTIYEDEIKASVNEDSFRKVTYLETDAENRKRLVEDAMGRK